MTTVGGLPYGLGEEEDFACGFAGFEISMGLGGFGEGVGVLDAEFERSGGYLVEDVCGAGFEVGAGSDVVLEGGAGDEEGAHGGEANEIEGRNGSAGSAEEDHGTARSEAGE